MPSHNGGGSPESARWQAEMILVSDSVSRLVAAGVKGGLTREAACLAALIAVVTDIRVEGLHEDALWKDAQRAVPRAR